MYSYGNISGKKTQRVVKGAALVGAGILASQLFNILQKQGMDAASAKEMTDQIKAGVIPMPKEIQAQIAPVAMAPVETTVFGLTLPTLAIIGVLGVGAYMVLSKK